MRKNRMQKTGLARKNGRLLKLLFGGLFLLLEQNSNLMPPSFTTKTSTVFFENYFIFSKQKYFSGTILNS